MAEYLSIKEFAKRANISTQAVYQRLQGDLSIFLKVDKGKKSLSTEALKFFTNKSAQPIGCTSASKPLQDEITLELIKTLQAQLAEKDKQIAEKDSQLKELTLALINEQKSAQQAHALHAGTLNQAALNEKNRASEKWRPRLKWFKKS